MKSRFQLAHYDNSSLGQSYRTYLQSTTQLLDFLVIYVGYGVVEMAEGDMLDNGTG